jgi:hypothetical protein
VIGKKWRLDLGGDEVGRKGREGKKGIKGEMKSGRMIENKRRGAVKEEFEKCRKLAESDCDDSQKVD